MTDTKIGHTNVYLTAWQKKQAAMLYSYTSLDYLKQLHKIVSDLINGVVDPLLDLVKIQGRDHVLVSRVWGDRNTSQNWANNAWPVLKDLQASLAKDIALRAANRFRITAVEECLRSIDQYSLDWATPGEEQALKLALSSISEYASQLDKTVDEYEIRWDDYDFAYYWPAYAAGRTRIPKFLVRPDIQAETGEVPPKTGVYICSDDTNAALQFAWSQNGGCQLREANTFNEIGLAALSAVGRTALWTDEAKMFAFATSAPYRARFLDLVVRKGESYPALAPAAVARSAFTTRACKWCLVEVHLDQSELIESLIDTDVTAEPIARRVAGGEKCHEAGFYLTPSDPNSRRFFAAGETMPKIESSYGETYWQWDASQGKEK